MNTCPASKDYIFNTNTDSLARKVLIERSTDRETQKGGGRKGEKNRVKEQEKENLPPVGSFLK